MLLLQKNESVNPGVLRNSLSVWQSEEKSVIGIEVGVSTYTDLEFIFRSVFFCGIQNKKFGFAEQL